MLSQLRLGFDVIKLVSCSIMLCIKCTMFANAEISTSVGTLTFISTPNTPSEILKHETIYFPVFRFLLAPRISCLVELSMNNVL